MRIARASVKIIASYIEIQFTVLYAEYSCSMYVRGEGRRGWRCLPKQNKTGKPGERQQEKKKHQQHKPAEKKFETLYILLLADECGPYVVVHAAAAGHVSRV